jgi:hypothetical protein
MLSADKCYRVIPPFIGFGKSVRPRGNQSVFKGNSCCPHEDATRFLVSVADGHEPEIRFSENSMVRYLETDFAPVTSEKSCIRSVRRAGSPAFRVPQMSTIPCIELLACAESRGGICGCVVARGFGSDALCSRQMGPRFARGRIRDFPHHRDQRQLQPMQIAVRQLEPYLCSGLLRRFRSIADSNGICPATRG